MKSVKQIAILMMLIGMVGIAMANPCPDPNSNEWTDDLLIDPQISVLFVNQPDNTIKVTVQGPSSTVEDGIPGFKEVCVDAGDVPTKINAVSALWKVYETQGQDHWVNWGAGISNNRVVEFVGSQSGATSGAASDKYNIPFDGIPHDVGTIQFEVPPQGQTKLLVHINDITKCITEDTCWRRPAIPTIPVPELSPLILTFAGLLGIVIVSRKKKSG